MKLHTIFALIASIFIRDVFQINLNYFIFILISNLCAKYNRMNAHSYEHIWCIQNTDAQKKYRTKRLENGPDVVIISKLICFFLKTHAHKRKEKMRGMGDVNKSMPLLPTNSFLFSILYQNQQSHTHILYICCSALNQIIGFITHFISFDLIFFFFSFRDFVFKRRNKKHCRNIYTGTAYTHYQHHITFSD